jgi:hypothetical protein
MNAYANSIAYSFIACKQGRGYFITALTSIEEKLKCKYLDATVFFKNRQSAPLYRY